MNMRRIFLHVGCVAVVLAFSGCGGKSPSAKVPGEAESAAQPASAAAAAAAYAEAEHAAQKTGKAEDMGMTAGGASFGVEFIEGNTSNLCAAQRIYMRAVDGSGRTLYGTSVTTNQLGVGQFSGVPVEAQKLEFIDSIKRRGELKVDLAPFAGAKRGELAGSCAF